MKILKTITLYPKISAFFSQSYPLENCHSTLCRIFFINLTFNQKNLLLSWLENPSHIFSTKNRSWTFGRSSNLCIGDSQERKMPKLFIPALNGWTYLEHPCVGPHKWQSLSKGHIQSLQRQHWRKSWRP